MVSREYIRPRTAAAAGGIVFLLIILIVLICGCLQIEPEELPPQTTPRLVEVTPSPTVSANIKENTSRISMAIAITSPKKTLSYREMEFPLEVTAAVSNYTEGKTTDTINGFLRWESVRARTSESDAARIRDQIHLIDYAVFNTTIKENFRLYIGVSGEQAKRIRNDSVYSENGYVTGSYDPSVIYLQTLDSSRDKDGYLTMCVLDFRRGDHLLLINETEREFLIPHGGIWDVAGEETFEQLTYTADSIPRYDDVIQKNIRLIYTQEHL
jgi:hypothetical protein